MFKWFRRKKKGPEPRTIFEGFVKRMDVRYGSFLWLQDRSTGNEFVSDLSIEKVIIDLPDGILSNKIETKTKDGLVKLKLRTILDDLGNRKGFYKFMRFNKPLYVKVFGVPKGDVELTFSLGAEGGGQEEE